MIIIAGALHVDPDSRARYLDAVSEVAVLARAARGCLDFYQSPDPIDPGRINVFERWESDEDVLAFRTSGGPDLDLPPIKAADVHKYRISATEAP
jgi:quinol monooxygenase YgiN